MDPTAADRVTTPYEGQPHPGWDASRPIAVPLALHDCVVPAAWADYNEHMTESAFLLAFGNGSDAFFRFVGIDEAYRAAGFSLFTVETHLRNLREASVGDRLELTLLVIGVDAKRLHIAHEMRSTGEVIATAEQMLLHVDTATGRTAPFPGYLRERLEVIATAHACVPRPGWIGRSIHLPDTP